MRNPDGSCHLTRELVPPGGQAVGIDVALVPLIVALWTTGYDTVSCCQDLGESLADISPRMAAYWKGWVSLEVSPDSARKLGQLAAEAGVMPTHWAEEGAWSMSLPVIFLRNVPQLLNIVQIRFPVSQLEVLTTAVWAGGDPR